jgi:hypothetical protein
MLQDYYRYQQYHWMPTLILSLRFRRRHLAPLTWRKEEGLWRLWLKVWS